MQREVDQLHGPRRLELRMARGLSPTQLGVSSVHNNMSAASMPQRRW